MTTSIAIPDSCLQDEKTQLDKSRKISRIARAAAIFQIDYIYIYQDNADKHDKMLLGTVLRYLETPPFLRKRLFPKVNELKYAGVLHPLNIPSHVTPANPKLINAGDVREGVIVATRGKKYIDVGVNQLVSYFGKTQVGKRATVEFKQGFPDFTIKEILKQDAKQYWGYIIKERNSLFSILDESKGKIILTSRKGKVITSQQVKEYQNESLLIAFGAIERGVQDILGGDLKRVQNAKTFNCFPNQATKTVRIEEAILGTLSILNIS